MTGVWTVRKAVNWGLLAQRAHVSGRHWEAEWVRHALNLVGFALS